MKLAGRPAAERRPAGGLEYRDNDAAVQLVAETGVAEVAPGHARTKAGSEFEPLQAAQAAAASESCPGHRRRPRLPVAAAKDHRQAHERRTKVTVSPAVAAAAQPGSGGDRRRRGVTVAGQGAAVVRVCGRPGLLIVGQIFELD